MATNKIILLLVFIFTLSIQTLFAQSDCDELQNKKVQKKFDDAMQNIERAETSRNKDYYYNIASQLLHEVEDKEPEFAGTYFFLGLANVNKKRLFLNLSG